MYSSEIDGPTREMYYKNFGEYPDGDICQVPSDRIPPHDILCGGFPCQSFSIAGKKQGLNNSGKLFYEIIRIANHHRPGILLLENVRNILTIDGGLVLSKIITEFQKIDYSVTYYVLNSSYFGVPQSRVRVYFVVTDNHSDKKIRVREPYPTCEKIYLEDILDNHKSNVRWKTKRDDYEWQEFPKENKLQSLKIGSFGGRRQGERVYSIKGHAVTQLASTGGYAYKTGHYLVDGRIRGLSLLECRRVMGFPDNHHVSKGEHGYRQLGNAVIPKMIEHVYRNLEIN